MKTFANSCVKLTSFYWLVSYSPKEVPQTLPGHCQSPPIHAVKTTDLKRENDTFPMLREWKTNISQLSGSAEQLSDLFVHRSDS